MNLYENRYNPGKFVIILNSFTYSPNPDRRDLNVRYNAIINIHKITNHAVLTYCASDMIYSNNISKTNVTVSNEAYINFIKYALWDYMSALGRMIISKDVDEYIIDAAISYIDHFLHSDLVANRLEAIIFIKKNIKFFKRILGIDLHFAQRRLNMLHLAK